MAKGDLYKLAIEAQKFINQDADMYRKLNSNTLPHNFVVSYEQVRKEVYIQITKKIEPDSAQMNLISRAVAKYVKGLYEDFSPGGKIKRFSVSSQVTGNERSFSALITRTERGGNPFNAINDIKKDRQTVLVDTVNKILQPHNSGHHNFNTNSFLDTGHVIGVADRLIDDALQPLRQSEAASLVSSVLKLKAASKFVGNSKIFTIEVMEESATGNRSDASLEKARLDTVKKALTKFIEKNNWADQAGSDSQKDFIEKTLINEFSKIKGYKGKKATINTSSSSVELVQKTSQKTRKVTDSVSLVVKPQRSSLNVVALLNRKLPPEIRKRMTYPRLQFRTGRFAESVRAVSYANGVVSYTYDKNPYQVFEPGVGRAPWATPARDPRSLINESIRAIAVDIISTKFRTRRV